MPRPELGTLEQRPQPEHRAVDRMLDCERTPPILRARHTRDRLAASEGGCDHGQSEERHHEHHRQAVDDPAHEAGHASEPAGGGQQTEDGAPERAGGEVERKADQAGPTEMADVAPAIPPNQDLTVP